MNQQLEHGMKVRAKRDIFNVCNGNPLWMKGETSVVNCHSEYIRANGWVIYGGVFDYTEFFEIIPDPMTAEEAMEKISAIDPYTSGYTAIDRIIAEYKKGRDNA